jgi:hypothetical protein
MATETVHRTGRSAPATRAATGSAKTAGKGIPVNARKAPVRNTPRAASSPTGPPTSSTGSASPEIVGRLGPFEIDWPRSLGYFGGIGIALGIGLIDPPVGLFIAAIPFLKMLKADRAPTPSQFVGQVLEGVAKPVGGDSQGTIRLASPRTGDSDQPVGQ